MDPAAVIKPGVNFNSDPFAESENLLPVVIWEMRRRNDTASEGSGDEVLLAEFFKLKVIGLFVRMEHTTA